MKKILSLILVAIMLVTAMPMAFAEGNTYQVGDIVQFGSYPQSEVKDETLIAELNALSPEWDDWTSYGYYSGTGDYGTMVQGDWMRYVDIELNGEKYRGVKFTQYRPYDNTSLDVSYQDENGYNINSVYWFKFESINWYILDPSTGFVVCDNIIDSQPYNNTIYSNGGGTYGCFNDLSYVNYASDYENSSIRKWLNNDFYNTAFSLIEQDKIKITNINNDGYKTSIGIVGYEALDSNETSDKIFLLSFNEAKSVLYGFDENSLNKDLIRRALGSDYAKIQGLFVYDTRLGVEYEGNSSWYLRSPGFASWSCCLVNGVGDINYDGSVDDAFEGIRPALIFKDISNVNQSLDNATELPDTSDEPEVKLNFFQKIIQWFKDLFANLFGWMK